MDTDRKSADAGPTDLAVNGGCRGTRTHTKPRSKRGRLSVAETPENGRFAGTRTQNGAFEARSDNPFHHESI